MTLGEFMIGVFLLGFGAAVGATIMHYTCNGISFAFRCIRDFIHAWNNQPYDHQRQGI